VSEWGDIPPATRRFSLSRMIAQVLLGIDRRRRLRRWRKDARWG
jgi:hypothetical protein